MWSQPGFLSCIVSHTKNHLRNKTEQFWKCGQKRGKKNMRTLHPLNDKGALKGLWETEKTRHFILIVWLPNMLHKKSHTSTILQHTFVNTRWIAVCWTILFRHFDSHFRKGEIQMDVFSVASPLLSNFHFGISANNVSNDWVFSTWIIAIISYRMCVSIFPNSCITLHH